MGLIHDGRCDKCGYGMSKCECYKQKIVTSAVDGYRDGLKDGYKDGMDNMKEKIRNYIRELNQARDLVATGAHPEYNGPFGAAVAGAQKTVLDNVISRLEEIIGED